MYDGAAPERRQCALTHDSLTPPFRPFCQAHSNIPVGDGDGTAAEETKEGAAAVNASLTQSQSRFAALNVAPLPPVVIAPGHKLNAEWLRLYLVHLRIFPPKASRKSLSLSASAAGTLTTSVAGKAEDGAGAEGSKASPKQPMPWLDWLGAKLVHDQKDAAGKVGYLGPLCRPLIKISYLGHLSRLLLWGTATWARIPLASHMVPVF